MSRSWRRFEIASFDSKRFDIKYDMLFNSLPLNLSRIPCPKSQRVFCLDAYSSA